MKAIFIGRFQPFHRGHLRVIKFISKKYKEIIIGIGSSQYINTKENPFSAEERKEMIVKSLIEADIKNFNIVLIPDIHNPPKWVEHVLSINSEFDVVFTNNDFTKKLFSEKGFQVSQTPLFNEDVYSGKIIRERINNNENWKDLVPNSVVEIIKKIDGEQRVKNL
jgi:nicotinamide-nucleotide adenylyltransferase